MTKLVLRLFGVVITEHNAVQLPAGFLVLEQGVEPVTVKRQTPEERALEEARMWWASVAGPSEEQ